LLSENAGANTREVRDMASDRTGELSFVPHFENVMKKIIVCLCIKIILYLAL